MSDWMNSFRKKQVNDLSVEEEFASQNKINELLEEEDLLGMAELSDEEDLEIVDDLDDVIQQMALLLEVINRELKAGFAVLQNESNARSQNMQSQINALDDKVTRSLLAMEDGNEKRALLIASALEEINDLVADPDGMTDVFKVAPDIAMGAIEREAQGELNAEKPFDPDDEIYLPEQLPTEEVEEPAMSVQELTYQAVKAGDIPPDDSYNEGGAGEIQMIPVPPELEGYSEHDYNTVMDYINGDIKWQDIVKHAGGMKPAKALVDPVKKHMELV
jgi:hypothetical protein